MCGGLVCVMVHRIFPEGFCIEVFYPVGTSAGKTLTKADADYKIGQPKQPGRPAGLGGDVFTLCE